ncbi:dipeptidase [Algibacter mikhailovii]|nr:membrane dipeptidase [Algibacter mikhailovii]
MKKSIFIATIILIGVVITAFNMPPSDESKTWESSEKGKTFVKESIVIDFYAPPFGVGWNESSQLHRYMERAMESGITGASITLAPTYFTWEQFQKEHANWQNTMLQKPDNFLFVHSVEDIERAHKEGKYAVIWNNQTSTVIDGDLSKIAMLKAMGLSSMQLVYNGTYRAGDGVISYLHGTDRGLTSWGKKVIDEMVKHGIIVDLSHTGRNTCAGIITYMTDNYPGVPVIYSHSLPNGLYKDEPHATEKGCYRNITDEQALAAAKTGGVVSPTFTEWMMDGLWPDDITPKQCANMIDYYIKLIGVDHVGIATDDMFVLSLVKAFAEANPKAYDDDGYMMDAFAKGAEGCGELAKILPAVTDELWKMGYTNEDIAKVYGGNMMRVYKEVW